MVWSNVCSSQGSFSLILRQLFKDVGGTGVPGENHQPLASNLTELYHTRYSPEWNSNLGS